MSVIRQDIEFISCGETCAGWLYLPERGAARSPAVAMAHGMGAIKEFYIPAFAEAFANAGVAALLFDYRGHGTSTGEPRERIDPRMQIEDYRSALTFLALHEAIDEDRLGVWGTSFSGGHVLHLGAYDPRVKVVVSQVGAMDLYANVRRVLTPEQIAAQAEAIKGERKRGYADPAPAYIPLSAPDGELALQPDSTTHEWLVRAQEELAPHWHNRVTLDSIERILEHAPALSIDRIAPKPLLMILARGDKWTPPELIREAFARAGEPKRLIEIEGDHYAVYSGAGHAIAAEAAAGWFAEHL